MTFTQERELEGSVKYIITVRPEGFSTDITFLTQPQEHAQALVSFDHIKEINDRNGHPMVVTMKEVK